MHIKTCSWLRSACIAASFLATATTVHAGVITSGATVLSTETFVINPATSTLTYNPGSFSFGLDGSLGPSPTTNYAIGGSFDVAIWTIDNGNTDWLTISNVNITANGLPSNFQMPDFINSQLIGNVFSGNGDICSIPSGGSCTSNGSAPSISGQLLNSSINFSAFVPVGSAVLGGASTYQINAASVVPVPAAFWLFASALGFYSITSRPKKS